MKNTKYILIFLIAFAFLSFTPEDKYIRQALKQLEKGNLKEAKVLYQKAIEKDPNSFKANVGMGLLLSELLDNYSALFPILKKPIRSRRKIPWYS